MSPEQHCVTSHVILCVCVLPSLMEVRASDMKGVVMCSWGTWTWLAEGKWSTSSPWALQAAESLFATWDQTSDVGWPLGWKHSSHWSCCSGHSTLSALDLSFCEESLWVWDMVCVCKGRTSRCPSSLGQLAIPLSPDDTPLHCVLPPPPHFLMYCGWTIWGAQLWLWRSETPWSPSPPFRRGQCCTPVGWPAPWLGCCRGCLPGLSHPPSPGIFRHLTFSISIYEALQI